MDLHYYDFYILGVNTSLVNGPIVLECLEFKDSRVVVVTNFHSEVRRLFKRQNSCIPSQPTFNMTGFCEFEPGRSSPRSEMESSKEYGSGPLIVLNSSVEKSSSSSQSTPVPLFSFLQM